MTPLVDDAPPPACGGCELGRRAFVVTAAQAVAAMLGVILLAPVASALQPDATDMRDAASGERRYPLPASDGVAVDDFGLELTMQQKADLVTFLRTL